MEHRKQENNIERRYSTGGLELRAGEGEGAAGLFGYALKFGVVYDMGWFTEEVSRTALDNADLTDVRILKNHDPNHVLGRTKSGTAQVGIDDIGLWYHVPSLPASPDGENMRVSIERGDIDQSSWGFMLRTTKESNGDKWEKRNGREHRILTDVKTVFDASPVTFPANPDTSVAKRSLEMHPPEEDTDQQEFQKRLRLLDMDLQLMAMQ